MLHLLSRSRAARALTAVALMGLPAISACSDRSPTAGTSGKFTLLLTDAPGDFKKAVVTISSVYLQAGEGENGGGRVVLRDTPITTDLLTLANSTADLVKDATLPAGSYAELRFVISGGYVEVENANGTTSIYASAPNYAGLPTGATVAGELQMPSFAQSGLKVTLPGGGLRLDGEQKIVLVDFDVSRSFGKAAGNSGRWVMSPVLTASEITTTTSTRVTVAKADSVTLPAINDTTLTLGRFKAVLSNAAGSREELALTDSNGDGTFEGEFRFIAPGTYQLDLKAPSDSVQFTTNPARPVSITVTGGTPATTALVITSARK